MSDTVRLQVTAYQEMCAEISTLRKDITEARHQRDDALRALDTIQREQREWLKERRELLDQLDAFKAVHISAPSPKPTKTLRLLTVK